MDAAAHQQQLNQFRIQLMLSSDSPNVASNPREMFLIYSLEHLIDESAAGTTLNGAYLSHARHKMSHVQCFAERYLHIFQYLQQYQNERLRHLLPASTEP